ncbi:helix-turn-helix protein [Motilibacter rhizosphaerae]|uniref:Helix-turn-helix protein n=1 Tax=Motilibacter rhizosphaerae TaxID=598652 RepID=A0A4Q7NYS4_9ACTN|nr:helix-turn-helix transcriptional regulator [Motilibacter rhizosphaerae]RZS91562.1 helix-turn-helix protein [Motilibacter rhizosphaerae]
MDSGSALGATIRTWRERLDPAAVGLPAGRARRAVGLRREELADLVGISVDYLVRLEQGRASSPSEQVVAALARALQLSPDERDHLYRLAHLAVPVGRVPEHVPPGVQRVLARLGDTAAAAVFAADWQLLWWNRGWVALLGDPEEIPLRQRNFARDCFAGHPLGPFLSRWLVESPDDAATEAAVVADLRRASARFPDDPRLAGLIAELLDASETFATLWAQGAVAGHREGRKAVHHPGVGPIVVDCDVLAEGDLEMKLVVLTAAPGSEDESRLRLALVAGSTGLPVRAEDLPTRG